MRKVVKSGLLKEIIQLYAVYFATVFFVYYMPPIITTVFLAGLLVVFFKSNKSYFWIAFIFIAESQPGSLFIITDSSHTLSVLQNTPVGFLFFWMVFVLVGFLKAYNIRTKYTFFLSGQIIAMLIYVAILLLAFGLYKMSAVGGLIPWLLLFTIPRLLKEMKDYERFFNLIFSFVFFVVITQIFFILTGTPISKLVGANLGDSSTLGLSIEYAGSALRPDAGIYIPFFSIIGCAFFLFYKNSTLSKKYMYVVMITSLFSIFITATRGWLIAGIIVILTFFLLSSKNPFSIVPKLILPTMLLLIIFNFVPLLKKQSDLVIERMSTLVELAEGDKTAGGTLSRLDERPKKVWKGFYQSPILGYGWGGGGSNIQTLMWEMSTC